jgi:hypothetical protein
MSSRSHNEVLARLNEQQALLSTITNEKGEVNAGPLTRLLIEGRIEILQWCLSVMTIADNAGKLPSRERLSAMLEKQKELIAEPEDKRKPNSISRVQIQGRVEILECLLEK